VDGYLAEFLILAVDALGALGSREPDVVDVVDVEADDFGDPGAGVERD
jgi:hypothetical protein